MTTTQNAIRDLLVAAGVDSAVIGDSPDGDTVVVEQGDDLRIVVGFDWSDDDAVGNELILGPDGWPAWVDYTRWDGLDVLGTDGGTPAQAARRIADLVGV